VRNALNQAMRDRLVEVFQLAVADPSVRSLEVSGRGPCFSSGGDLFEFGTAPDPVTAHVARTTRSPASWLARCAGSASFFVHGACRGAGVELATFARRVTADPAATFALPELSMGLVPGAGGTVSIPRRIGRHRFAYLALTGAVIDAPLAHDWGLVDEVTGAHDGALPAPADPAGC
jgi:enoyl-CoA hydratase/carnithine racemase